MRILVTGATGALGRPVVRIARDLGHDVAAPARTELDLFDATAVADAVAPIDAVLHLATRIPSPERRGDRGAWEDNDLLRVIATRVLVDAALATHVRAFVFPSVTFVYPPGAGDEDVPIDAAMLPAHLRSALLAEGEVARFAASGRRGASLRLGLLWGPGTGLDEPAPRADAVLHVDDAARALVAALDAPSGVYNVIADGGRFSRARFTRATGWTPASRAGP